MKQGIQSTCKNPDLQRWGCYFFDLLRIAELHLGISYSEDEAISDAERFKNRNWIGEEVYILDPLSILKELTGKVWGLERRRNIKIDDKFVIQMGKSPNNNYHFTLVSPEEWDSLNPARPQAGIYTPVDYRVFN